MRGRGGWGGDRGDWGGVEGAANSQIQASLKVM